MAAAPPFPVDVVVTWCGSRAPTLLKTIESYFHRTEHEGIVCRETHDLRYCLRSLCANLPWHRNIVLVLDSMERMPDWLRAGPGLRVVHHAEFMPAGLIPSFNSNVIESFIHLIPRLSEHFLYVNDDMYIARPAPWTAFFTPRGRAGGKPINRHMPGPGAVATLAPDSNLYTRNWKWLSERYGLTDYRLQHQVTAYRKSLIARYGAEKYGTGGTLMADVVRAGANKFRMINDVNLLRVSGALATQHCDAVRVTADPDVEAFFEARDVAGIRRVPGLAKKGKLGFLCINNSMARFEHVYRALQTLFPEPVCFEVRPPKK